MRIFAPLHEKKIPKFFSHVKVFSWVNIFHNEGNFLLRYAHKHIFRSYLIKPKDSYHNLHFSSLIEPKLLFLVIYYPFRRQMWTFFFYPKQSLIYFFTLVFLVGGIDYRESLHNDSERCKRSQQLYCDDSSTASLEYNFSLFPSFSNCLRHMNKQKFNTTLWWTLKN